MTAQAGRKVPETVQKKAVEFSDIPKMMKLGRI